MNYGRTGRGLATLVLICAAAQLAAGEPTLEQLHARVEELTAAASLDEAVRVAREAVVRADREFGSGSMQAARSHDLLATALMDLGEDGPAEALPHCERSVAILEKTTGEERVGYARALWTCGRVRLRLDDLSAAQSDLLAALAVLQETPDDPTTARVLDALVWIQSSTGSYEAALANARRHAEILARLVPTDAAAWELTMALYTVARLTIRVHGHQDAIVAYERALESAESTLAPEDPRRAWILNGLAIVREDSGDFLEARALYEQALDLSAAGLGESHEMTRSCRYNLAILLRKLGDYAAALEELETMLRIDRELNESDDPGTGMTLFSIAEVLHLLGDTGGAESRYVESLELLESNPRTERPTLARAHWGFGVLLTDLDRLDEAARQFDRAQALLGESLDAGHENFCRLHNSRGRMLERAGRLDESLASFAAALEIAKTSYGTDHPIFGTILLNRSIALARTGAAGEAFQDAWRADEITVDHVGVTAEGLSERQALGYRATAGRGLDVMLSILESRSSPADARKAWDAVVRSRALVLEVAARRLRSGSADAETAELVRQLATASRRYANLTVRGDVGASDDSLRRRIAAARAERESLERAVSVASAKRQPELVALDATAGDVLQQLGPRDALVSYALYTHHDLSEKAQRPPPETRYAAWVAEPSRAPRLVFLGSAAVIDERVSDWHRGVSWSPLLDTDPDRAESLALEKGVRLRERIWDPLGLDTTHVDRLYVVPDGALQLVNLHALPRTDGTYLVESLPGVRMLTAERDLVGRPSPVEEGRGALIVGNVDFDSAGHAGEDSTFRGSCIRPAEFPRIRFGALPGTGPESEEVTGLVERAFSTPDDPADVVRLTGLEASERRIKQLAPGRELLHLATHGFFLGAGCGESGKNARGIGGLASSVPAVSGPSGSFGLSGLALAGANARNTRGPDQEDGILTADEIAVLDLAGMRLAVLSACQTGAGAVAAGEGILGLRRAFQIAGVRNLVVSLWAVDDEATIHWMRLFYVQFAESRKEPAEALRTACRSWLREARSEDRSTHSFYWGSWLALGP